MKGRHVDGRWTDFPEIPTEKAVYDWLSLFQDEFLSDARGIYYTSKSSSELTGAEARRQLDVFVKPSGVDRSNAKHDWKDDDASSDFVHSLSTGSYNIAFL